MQEKPYESVLDLIGSTPMVRLRKSLEKVPAGQWLKSRLPSAMSHTIRSEVYAKVEYLNPGGSVKDRIARTIVESAEKQGLLKPGGTIVEATSGNTGAGLALVAAVKGYKCVFVMPDKMSAEKINALRAYGARVVVTPLVEPDHPDYYCNVAKRLSQEIPGAFLANQYFNPDNPRAHEESTGPEIWAQMQQRCDLFVAGLGTGGTFTGTTRFLKKKHPGMKAVGVDPVGSIYYGMVREKKPSEAGSYLTEGVGEDMMPGTVDLSLCDDCVQVNDDEAFGATRMLAQKEGLLVGGSCGMAFYGLAQYLMLHELQGGAPLRATVILPDSGSRYLSKVFNSPWLEKNNLKAGWGEAAFTGDVVYQGAARRVDGV